MNNRANQRNLLIAMYALLLAIYLENVWLKALFTLAACYHFIDFGITYYRIDFEQKNTKAINLRTANLPPELKEKIDEVDRLMRIEMQNPNSPIFADTSKCNDPHCEACHPENNE